MLDHDVGKRGIVLNSPGELVEILTDLMPEFAQAAYCWRRSISAGVHKVGEDPTPGRGFHLYCIAEDASDIPIFRDSAKSCLSSTLALSRHCRKLIQQGVQIPAG
jgi:hypothetical protein